MIELWNRKHLAINPLAPEEVVASSNNNDESIWHCTLSGHGQIRLKNHVSDRFLTVAFGRVARDGDGNEEESLLDHTFNYAVLESRLKSVT